MNTELVLGINNLSTVLGPVIGGIVIMAMALVMVVLAWRALE